MFSPGKKKKRESCFRKKNNVIKIGNQTKLIELPDDKDNLNVLMNKDEEKKRKL